MINIKKYFYSAFVVYLVALSLLLIGWTVALSLTKQRVQLESQNKLENISSKQTPFVWDFINFSKDVVEPFQYHWQHDELKHDLLAKQGSNPQLSLNFSGEVINTGFHNKLIINSASTKPFNLKIQFKSELDDEIFWYSKNISIKEPHQTIDLDTFWLGVIDDSNKTLKGNWGSDKHKVSSLVLHFTNPQSDITIDNINIPYVNKEIKYNKQPINCQGEVEIEEEFNAINVLMLNEFCWLPSNYMWLKHYVQQRYPESILSIRSLKLRLESDKHKVNKSYASNIQLNTILYALVGIILIIVFLLRKKYSHIEKVKEESWYKWAGKQLLFKGASKAITPYHFVVNYLFVLVPTVVLLLIMMYLKFPNLTTIKQLPMYFLWALLQQFILGYVLAQRLFYNRIQNRLIASILAGLVFSILHLPSVTLMIATFIAGCFWSYAWLVFKRLLPLAISHALLALMFYLVISDRFLYSAKVFQWFWE